MRDTPLLRLDDFVRGAKGSENQISNESDFEMWFTLARMSSELNEYMDCRWFALEQFFTSCSGGRALTTA